MFGFYSLPAEPIIVLACQVLGNLMREEVTGSAGRNVGSCISRLAAQDELARRGALEALQAHMLIPGCSNKVGGCFFCCCVCISSPLVCKHDSFFALLLCGDLIMHVRWTDRE